MKYIADLHIHSPFSRATSKESTLAGLCAWAQVKGINLVGTGDFTHPGWLRHLKEHLQPAEPGLFKLKDQKVPPAIAGLTPEEIPVRFLLSAEVSSIYKRGGKVRKIHNILYAPDFASVERINAKLAALGNIESDGRPILGLDARDLLEIVLTEAPEGFLVPAHIWTPWFSLFGSKSGFDTIEECFGPLTPHIFALETGLSSDPEMNRLLSQLDRFTLISNSDCHSPGKLGREANLFDTGFDYFSLRQALKDPASGGFAGTVEFFPEEGKYHLDGHRNCKVSLEPAETRKLNNRCPVCGRPLTVGVLHRVMELADRQAPIFQGPAAGVSYLVPLTEVLGEIIGQGPATKGVMQLYTRLVARFGSEFNILLHTPVEELNRVSPVLGEAVARIRSSRVIRHGGFDGEFGVIKLFAPGELTTLAGQIELFKTGEKKVPTLKKKAGAPLMPLPKRQTETTPPPRPTANTEQQTAITAADRHILVTAGPGTGKTYTLVGRIAHLLDAGKATADKMAAITFTNRAADELRERLSLLVGDRQQQLFVGTFHAFCLHWLRRAEPDLRVIGAEERLLLLKELLPNASARETNRQASQLGEAFELGVAAEGNEVFDTYLAALKERRALDLDQVVPELVARLATENPLREELRENVRHLFVDEFQDVNKSQYELVQQLAEHATLFAIGDPDQSIYGFRGSDLRFFSHFAEAGSTRSIGLTQNYRSAPIIIEAATALIRHNRVRATVELTPQSAGPGKLEYYRAPSAKAEAEFIVKKIEELLGGVSHFSINTGRSDGDNANTLGFADIAVLYRLSRQADELAEALNRRGIPIQLIGVPPFYMAPHLRPLFLWVLAGASQADFGQQLALLAGRPGIGRRSLELLAGQRRQQSGLLDGAPPPGLPEKSAATLLETARQLERFRETCHHDGLVPALIDLLPRPDLQPASEECQRFLELAGIFGHGLESFAGHLRRHAEATIYDERAEAVPLMTLHAAKGLEFPAVFITGLEEGLLPCNIGNQLNDIEEERRLLYVGMTRARQQLILTGPARRLQSGRNQETVPSRFLEEIPDRLLVQTRTNERSAPKPAARQMRLF